MIKFFTLLKKLASIHPVADAGHSNSLHQPTTVPAQPIHYSDKGPAHAGSLLFHFDIPISSTNKNFFMETLLHGFKRSIPALFLFSAAMFFAGKSSGQGSQTFNTPGTFTFTVPVGINSITVAAWGGGGAGGGVTGGNPRAGGGGEGGSFVRGTITVTPGATYTVVVGNGGTGSTGNGTAGAATSFGGSGLFNAIGGVGGAAGITGSTFGAGGNATNTGDAVSGTATSDNYGGDGGTATNASTASSGGGGGSAGAGGGGGNGGSPLTAGTAGAAGSPSAPGATGGAGRGSQSDGNGNAGNAPGAGGSGGRNANNSTTYTGGAGGNGQVIVTWTCPADAGTLSGIQSICINGTTTFSSTLAGGTWSSGSNSIATINSSTGVIAPVASGTATMTYTLSPSGCTTRTGTRTVTVSATPTTSFIKTDVLCFNTSTGTIVVTGIGGASPYTYSINNGTSYQAGSTFNNLPAQVYKIRVKDNNGCESKSVQ
jgi:hypothetical protein